MRAQQQHYADLTKTEIGDSQRMETMEQRKLQEFERRKALERERKKNKVAAHRKMCSRTIAKSYIENLKGSSIGYLKDVGYFTDQFRIEILEQNVLPWIFSQVENFVDEIDSSKDISDMFLSSNVDEEMIMHERTVNAERDRKKAVRKAIEDSHHEKL